MKLRLGPLLCTCVLIIDKISAFQDNLGRQLKQRTSDF
jgi:hypothetical protein